MSNLEGGDSSTMAAAAGLAAVIGAKGYEWWKYGEQHLKGLPLLHAKKASTELASPV